VISPIETRLFAAHFIDADRPSHRPRPKFACGKPQLLDIPSCLFGPRRAETKPPSFLSLLPFCLFCRSFPAAAPDQQQLQGSRARAGGAAVTGRRRGSSNKERQQQGQQQQGQQQQRQRQQRQQRQQQQRQQRQRQQQRPQRTSSQQPQGTGAAAAEQQPDQLAASTAAGRQAAAAAAAAAATQLTSPQPARSSLVRVLRCWCCGAGHSPFFLRPAAHRTSMPVAPHRNSHFRVGMETQVAGDELAI